MDFEELVNTRRSVRGFRAEPVLRNVIPVASPRTSARLRASSSWPPTKATPTHEQP
jgi:hypothetical protein